MARTKVSSLTSRIRAPLFSPRFLAIAEANPDGPRCDRSDFDDPGNQPGAHGRPLEIRARAIKCSANTM